MLNNQLALSALLALGCGKLGARALGGGPWCLAAHWLNLLAGACLGGVWGALGAGLFGLPPDVAKLFALFGNGAVMAASLNAPFSSSGGRAGAGLQCRYYPACDGDDRPGSAWCNSSCWGLRVYLWAVEYVWQTSAGAEGESK